MAPEQIEWLQGLAGKALPGALYVTVFLMPPADENGLWTVDGWEYLFEPDLEVILNAIPPKEPPPAPPRLPEPPPLPPMPPSNGDLRFGRTESMIVPPDCEPNPNPIAPNVCLNYPELVAPWYCRENPHDRRCEG